jgi:transposase
MFRMPSLTTSRQHPHYGGEEVIVGVDTHKDTHTAAVITILGVLSGHPMFPASRADYGQ